MPDDPAEITDYDVREWWPEVRRARLDKNLPVPRFVSALNRAGYAIDIATYKRIEKLPLEAVDHVREGILRYVEKVFSSERVPDSAQTPSTVYAMAVLSDARKAKGLTYNDMSQRLMTRGIAMQPNSIRTAEQGITRVVPFDYIAVSAEILEIDPVELFHG